jgi:hypothetical protein
MIEMSPNEASELIRQDLREARHDFQTANLESALDRFVRALGLALQLGPAATERVLAAVMATAREMAKQRNANALSALGPSLVGLTTQVREEAALCPTAAMEAWSAVISGVGTLLGQLGLALTIAPDHRSAMMTHTHTHARILDDATGNRFGLADWIDQISADLQAEEPGGCQIP